MGDDAVFTMSQVSKKLGVKSYILRGYCNKGLVPGLKPIMVGRHRVFTSEQVDYLRQAVCLSRAGFSTKDLRKYVHLMQEGDKTVEERLAMIRTHKRQVWQELEDLQATIDYLERQEETLGLRSGNEWY